MNSGKNEKIRAFTCFVFDTFFCTTSNGQNKIDPPTDTIKSEYKDVITSPGPKSITRSIIQDRKGNIWIAAFDGVFRYDGKSFRNYKINEESPDSHVEAKFDNDINCIMEDKTGKFWFGTRGYACVYDRKKFAILTHNGKGFTNVRTIIEDKRGIIWLGGSDGLWRYDGSTFTNVTENFVGCIYEEKKGNVWTSSVRAIGESWALSRYDEASLLNQKLTVTEIKSEYEDNRGMIFGILEANDGNIWFGTLTGVRRYDGNTVTDFKGKEVKK